MSLMMEINLMLLNNNIAKLSTALLLSIITINCFAQTPVVDCPTTFFDNHHVYHFFNASLFDGQLTENVELVPEFKKEKAIWFIDSKIDPYLVCKYAGTKHYIVLYVKGASYCQNTKHPMQATCMQ